MFKTDKIDENARQTHANVYVEAEIQWKHDFTSAKSHLFNIFGHVTLSYIHSSLHPEQLPMTNLL